MDLPSELLLTIAEYEPNVHLQIDPHEILRRIMVINPNLNLEPYLLELLEFANKQAKIGNNVAHDLYLYFKGIGIDEYSIQPSDNSDNGDTFAVSAWMDQAPNVDPVTLNRIFGRNIDSEFRFYTDSEDIVFGISFTIPRNDFVSIVQDTVDVASIYKTKYKRKGEYIITVYFQ